MVDCALASLATSGELRRKETNGALCWFDNNYVSGAHAIEKEEDSGKYSTFSTLTKVNVKTALDLRGGNVLIRNFSEIIIVT